MSSSPAPIETFLDELYASAVEPDRWHGVLHSLMRLFNTDKSHFGLRENRSGSVKRSNFFGFTDTEIRLGLERYFAIDTWAIAIEGELRRHPLTQTGSTVLHGGSLVPHKDFIRTEYFNDYCRQIGMADALVMGGILDETNSFGFALNTNDGREFDEAQVSIAYKISNHLVRALRLHNRISKASHVNQLAHFWQDSAVALIVLQQRRIEFTNPAAMALLQQGKPVCVQGNGLSFQDSDVQAAFDQMASPIRTPSGPRPHILSFPVQADDDSRWLVQLITLKPAEGSLSAATGLDGHSVMIAITPLTSVAAARQNAIQGFIRFTETERDVLLMLVQGLSANQIARRTGRKPSTIRWHIRSLIEKLHARSIADVVRIGALLLPL